MKYRTHLIPLLIALVASPAFAHDDWIETGDSRTDVGKTVHIDLKLGNHGNHHRDFKLKGQVDPHSIKLTLIGPGDTRTNLKPSLTEAKNTAGQPFWRADVEPPVPGLYTVACLDDKIVHYAPKRSIKSAKAFFLVGAANDHASFKRVLGHPLELVPLTDPVIPAEASELTVQLLFHGEPLADTRISFVPRGVELQGDFDPRYERRTDDQGRASFTAEPGNVYLIVARHEDDGATGDGYESTAYAATLTVNVPKD